MRLCLREKTKNTVRKKVALVGDGQIKRIVTYAYFLGAAKSLSPLYSVASFYLRESLLRIYLAC